MAVKMKTGPKPPAGRRKADGKPMPIDRFAEEVDRQYVDEKSTPTTRRRARRIFRMLKEGCGVRTTADLNDEAVERFQALLGAGFVPATRSGHLRWLKALCYRAFEMGCLSSMPAFPIIPSSSHFPRTTKSVPTPSPEEMKRYLEYLRGKAEEDWSGHRTFALVATLAYAGLKRTEAFRLRVSDIDLERGTIFVGTRTGGRQSRFKPEVRMATEIKLILKEWLPKCGCEWVFPGLRRRGPWEVDGNRSNWKNNPRNVIRDQARLAGIETPITFGSLRRFYLENVVPFVPGIGPDPTPGRRRKRPKKSDSRQPGPRPRPCVTLGKPSQPVSIRNTPKGVLTRAEHKAVAVLRAVCPRGLTMREMVRLTQMSGSRISLLRLKEKDPDWDGAIIFPSEEYEGKKSNYYRMAVW
jgi:integrase